MSTPYVPTPDDLDDICARIASAPYASDAVERFEDWTREKWGVESAFTTQYRLHMAAERVKDAAAKEAATPYTSPSPFLEDPR